ncbi:MAG: hypothetical protein OIF58_09460 [Cohaesibacter sp.]|nr:hypothetical protein [Cohaesibacter sp.]
MPVIAMRYLFIGGFFFLSGCIGIENNARIDSEGMVNVDMSLRINATMAGMTKQDDGEFCPTQPKEFEKRGVRGLVTRTVDEKDIICRIQISTSLEKLMQALNNAEDKWIQIVELEESYRVIYQLKTKAPINKEHPFYEMILAATNGYSLVATITAPRIIGTSGKISEDKTTARVAMPTSMLFKSDQEPLKHWIEFSTSEPGFIERLFGKD